MADQLTKYFAGSPSKPGDREFLLMVQEWTRVLQDKVPEYRLGDAFVQARQTRNSTFQLDVSEVCAAWNVIREAERYTPPVGSYEWSRAREVCADCNGTGTVLFVKRDPILMRDYTYAKYCTSC